MSVPADRLSWLLPPLAAMCGLGLLCEFAPRYLLHQGFPLDDAWIHAVYARELALSGVLAYNPGVPATGDTAPLWPLLLAPIYRLASDVASAVLATKLFGFALHAAACTMIGLTIGRLDPDRRLLTLAGAAIIAIHPDLLAASLSGMEVSLAALAIGGILAASVSGSALGLMLMGAVAIGARPEVAAMAATIPALFWIRVSVRRSLTLSAASVAGSFAALVALGLRNQRVSGLFLPATFYAKASTESPLNLDMQQRGFIALLGHLPLVNSVPALVLGLAGSVFLLWFRSDSAWNRAAAALYLSGALFCGLSFALIPPLDPPAFYHQRYVLPGVTAMIAAIPVLVLALVRGVVPRAEWLTGATAIAALAVPLLVATPSRARHLSNDAQNIDDVQVALGRALAKAEPTDAVWVVDAGAARFFGRPFVVDMIGLNTPELLGSNAQAYLGAHPPAYLDVFPGWSRLEVAGPGDMPATTFEVSTPYTVTSAPSMRRHVLVICAPPGVEGDFIVRGKRRTFRCSS